MDSELETIEQQIDRLTKEIIVPLRHKEINEEAFSQLFQIIELLIINVSSKEEISRKTAGLFFLIYTQLETQGSYSTSEQIGPINKKKSKLAVYMRKIFGGILENEK